MVGKCKKAETFDRDVCPTQSELLQQKPKYHLRRLASDSSIRGISFTLRVYEG